MSISNADKKRMANKVLKLRKDLNMTEEEFSKLINVSTTTLEDIELGCYKGSVRQLIDKICKTTNAEKSFFKGVISESKKSPVKKKNTTTITKITKITEDNEFDSKTAGILKRLSFDYTIEEISKFPNKDFVFYENIYNTLELKNKEKTRICAYCGKKVSVENLTPEHVIYKCDCQEFIDNTNEIKELSRKQYDIVQSKLENHYEEHLKRDDVSNDMTEAEYFLGVSLFCLKFRTKAK